MSTPPILSLPAVFSVLYPALKDQQEVSAAPVPLDGDVVLILRELPALWPDLASLSSAWETFRVQYQERCFRVVICAWNAARIALSSEQQMRQAYMHACEMQEHSLASPVTYWLAEAVRATGFSIERWSDAIAWLRQEREEQATIAGLTQATEHLLEQAGRAHARLCLLLALLQGCYFRLCCEWDLIPSLFPYEEESPLLPPEQAGQQRGGTS